MSPIELRSVKFMFSTEAFSVMEEMFPLLCDAYYSIFENINFRFVKHEIMEECRNGVWISRPGSSKSALGKMSVKFRWSKI